MSTLLSNERSFRLQILRPGDSYGGGVDSRSGFISEDKDIFHVYIDRCDLGAQRMGLGVQTTAKMLLVQILDDEGAVAEYNRRVHLLPPAERSLAWAIEVGDAITNINGRCEPLTMGDVLRAPP